MSFSSAFTRNRRGLLLLGLLALTLGAAHPARGAKVISIYGGARTCIVLMDDGSVWQWGANTFGQLGDGSTTDRYTPIQVRGPGDVGTLNQVIKIMGGEPYNFALRRDGSVWTWGYNALGSLGDGTTVDSHVPVQVHGANNVGFLGAITGLGGRGYHSLALAADGTVWTWGFNQVGQLGDGTTTNRPLPWHVGGLSDVIAVTGGYTFSMALKSDHTLWTWGGNANGELGDGTNVARPSPVPVQGGLTNVIQASSGWKHAVALKGDGTVWTWGRNDKSQLGDGLTANRNLPFQVPGMANVVAVSGGDCHTTALKADGTVWTWGCYGRTQVNPTTIIDYVHPAPVQVPGISNVVMIAARDYHNVAVEGDGSVWTWGWNIEGQLGNGTTVDSETPVQVIFPTVAPCIYALAPLDLSNSLAAGGAAAIIVTVPAGCPVTATSFQPWVTVNSITPNGATTTISLQIAANVGAARATSVVVADRLFLVTQLAP